MESFVLHEDHVSYFHSSDEIFKGWSHIASTGPDILDESNLIWIDTESFCQPSEVELNDLFLEEFVIVWIVEDLDTHHDETRVMSSSDTNIVQIIESSTELRADQWVGWWIKLTSNAIRLETENTSSHEVNIVSPSGDDWISLDGSAWNSSSGETLFESLPSLGVGDLFTFSETIVDEGVFTLTVGITTGDFFI